jgi:hypothetical protein
MSSEDEFEDCVDQTNQPVENQEIQEEKKHEEEEQKHIEEPKSKLF